MNTNKKYNKADGKKESRENGRNLCFHDWLIVRELKGLDEAYDERMRCFNYGILMLAENEDSDERQKMYDEMLEERERIRAIYIQRRNELKAGFTGRQEKGIKRYLDTDMCNRVERLSDYGHGYVLSDKEAKAALNKRFGCIDESAEFKDDPIVEAVLDERNMSKKPDTVFVFNDHSELKGLRRFTNPIDDVGPATALTPKYLDNMIREYNKEDE